MNEEDALHRALVSRLCSFLQKLCNLHFSPPFILQAGFEFALCQQYEYATQGSALLDFQMKNTVRMEQAASWLEEAVQLDNRVYSYLNQN